MGTTDVAWGAWVKTHRIVTLGHLHSAEAQQAATARALPPELEALAEGLSRLLGGDAVRAEVVGVDSLDLEQLADELGRSGVAVLSPVRAGEEGPLPVTVAAEAALAAGLNVAWSGYTRNTDTDIRRQTPVVVVADALRDEVRDWLSTGSSSLVFDRDTTQGTDVKRAMRVCVASYEVAGPTRNGGIGTASAALAELLADAGHHTSLVYTGAAELGAVARARWTGFYGELGVDFIDLAAERPDVMVDTPFFNQARAYKLYRWLANRDREEPWDVVHVPECQGHGYYALLARRAGSAFRRCTVVVGTHSPTRWVYEANGWAIGWPTSLVDDFLERGCVELADVVLSPTAYLLGWMEQHGWKLPQRRFVQQYPLRLEEAPKSPHDRRPARVEEATAVEEIVFFGRLESRKGLTSFCDSLDLLSDAADIPQFRVCFLGKESEIEGVAASRYLAERGRGWGFEWRIEPDLDRCGAINYLRKPGRLAVMPSPIDNCPNTVLEALGLGIPFVTSTGGGIPELIEPADLDDVAFDPADGPQALAESIRRALMGDNPIRPRFAIDPTRNAEAHVRWHQQVLVGRMDRRPRSTHARTPDTADRSDVTICLEVSGADDLESLEGSLRSLESQDLAADRMIVLHGSAARAAGVGMELKLAERGWRVVKVTSPGDPLPAGDSRGWVLLVESGITAERDLLSRLLTASQRCSAEIATATATYADTDDGGGDAWSGNVPLGGAPLPGLCFDCFGIGAALIRGGTLDELGGLRLEGAAGANRRDLLARAALAGLRFAVVPDPLLCVGKPPRRPAISPAALNRMVAPYRSALPPELADLPGLYLTGAPAATRPTSPERGGHETYIQELEDRMASFSSSRSWRVTAPLRAAARILRRRGATGDSRRQRSPSRR